MNKILFGVLSMGLVTCALSAQAPAQADHEWRDGRWRDSRYNSMYNNHWGNFNNGSSRWRNWDGSYVDNFQSRINSNIQRGLTNGRLTQAEVDALNRRQAQIDALQTRYNADGRLSFSERARLGARATQLQAQLWREMNDRNNRGRWY